MIDTDVVELLFAQRMHRKIQELVKAGDKAEAIRLRRRYHEWLASYHYHEVWERASETVVSRTRISQRVRRYQLVGLACTAGQSWGGS